MKKLKDILKGISYYILNGSDEIEINKIKYDSRKVEKNDIYFALVGYNADGHDYIKEAIKKGASTIVISKIMNIKEEVTVIKVDDTRLALAYASANYFDNPARELTLIGVTGTTGKTTTTHMIRDILKAGNIKCGLIISIKINSKYSNNKFNFNSVNYLYNKKLPNKETFRWTVNNKEELKCINKGENIITDNTLKMYKLIKKMEQF